MSEMKTGLIMEGGAMRGMFTCGIIDVFLEEKIEFDGAAGISAGAVFGCNLKSKQIGRGIRYNKKYCNDWRYCSIKSLIKTGDLYGVDFCYHQIPDILDPFDRKIFSENPMEFYAAATDVVTGENLYHRCTDGGVNDMTWLRASASMPLASGTVEVDGHELLDGGICEAVPYDFMISEGYDRNVLIMTQPKGYRKTKFKLLPLLRIKMRKYPKIIEAMSVRHERYNKQMEKIDAEEEKGEILVIRPPESLGVRRAENNPNELERVYQIGRREAYKRLEEIRVFIKGTY